MKRILCAVRATVLLFLATASALAQFETASVVGTVRDSSGAVVGDAKVTLTNHKPASATKESDANGSYEFFTVRIGTYVITAEKDGFSIALVDNVAGHGRRPPARRPDHGGRPVEREGRGQRRAPCCCRPTRAIAAR